MSGSLSDPRVKRAAAEFVCSQVDVDARKDLYRRYRIEDVPCVLFFDASSSVVGRKENDYENTPERLIEAMEAAKRSAVAVARAEDSLLARTLASPSDPDVAIELGNHYYVANRFADARDAYRRAFRLLPESAQDVAVEVQIRIVDLDISLGETTTALEEIDRFLAGRPDSPRRDGLAFYRGYAFYDRGDHDRAIAEWRAFLEKYPSSGLRKEVEDYLLSLGG